MAITCAGHTKAALQNGVLGVQDWPIEPHILAYDASCALKIHVWSSAQWLTYGDDYGESGLDQQRDLGIRHNGSDHYDAYACTGEMEHHGQERAVPEQSRRVAIWACAGVQEEKVKPAPGDDGDEQRQHDHLAPCILQCILQGPQEAWCIATLNITSWGQAIVHLEYIASGEFGYSPDILCFQEHKGAKVRGDLSRMGSWSPVCKCARARIGPGIIMESHAAMLITGTRLVWYLTGK
eukprot:4586157-Amphidinium_carterae.1